VNTVWLAQQGFDVVGLDVSPRAIDRARQRAPEGGGTVQFLTADVLQLNDLRPDFRFFFDRGCYHVVRKLYARRFIAAVAAWTFRGALGLVLAGNAKEPQVPGPPVVSEDEFRKEWGEHFDVLWLREFRFDQPEGMPGRPLGWAGLVRRLQPS